MNTDEQSRKFGKNDQSGFNTWSNDGDEKSDSTTLKAMSNSFKEKMTSSVVKEVVNRSLLGIGDENGSYGINDDRIYMKNKENDTTN